VSTSRIRFHVAARAEPEASIRWYDERVPGLGHDFLTEVERCVAEIAEHPTGWPVDPRDPRARRIVMSRFPYSVVYVALPGGDLVIVAVAHAKRRPGYWQARVPQPR
jgi:plasmid stabilization system protein ParE